MTTPFARWSWLGLMAATSFLLTCLAMPAQAGIIRSPGGTVQQDSFNETVALYDDSTVDYRASRMVSGQEIGSYSRNSLHFPAYATPPELCWDNIIRDVPGVELRTDCHYEFVVGEMLELMGATAYHINGADYLLTWLIEGMGHSWSFSNSSLDFAQLQMAMPDDMGPGEYMVSFTFRQIAPEGYGLFRYSNILDPYRCDEADNRDGTGPEIVCGQIGSYSAGGWTEWTDGTSLIILDRTVPVPSPAALSLLLLGGIGLLTARRQRSAN